uniref:Cyclin N-terminal domain-containing protein n=1 Tax=Meloidogyne incognita TaxID=6306 RepID=A0A914N6S1_MELIC
MALFGLILTALLKVQGKYLHCVAVSSLGLAVKFHEEIDAESEAFEANRAAAIILAIPSPEPLNSDELAAEIRAQSEFSQKELNRMERTLLARLSWDLLLPSFDRFLHAMLAVIGTPHLAVSRILRRNFELIVSNGHLVWSYSSSVLALSTLSIMLEFTTQEWKRITESLTSIFQVLIFKIVCFGPLSVSFKIHNLTQKITLNLKNFRFFGFIFPKF